MYKIRKFYKTDIRGRQKTEGETIEIKVSRLTQNKEPINDGAPLIFTERKDGVKAAYNIRSDRWEIATDAMDKIHKSKQAASEAKYKAPEVKEETKIIEMKGEKTNGVAESTQGKIDSK